MQDVMVKEKKNKKYGLHAEEDDQLVKEKKM